MGYGRARTTHPFESSRAGHRRSYDCPRGILRGAPWPCRDARPRRQLVLHRVIAGRFTSGPVVVRWDVRRRAVRSAGKACRRHSPRFDTMLNPARDRSAPGALPAATQRCTSTLSRRKFQVPPLVAQFGEPEGLLEERHGPVLIRHGQDGDRTQQLRILQFGGHLDSSGGAPSLTCPVYRFSLRRWRFRTRQAAVAPRSSRDAAFWCRRAVARRCLCRCAVGCRCPVRRAVA